jgi:hypothetical protein
MSAKPKKRIAPTLVANINATNVNATNVNATNVNAHAFETAAQKKNPLENAADMIAMRYGISAAEAPQINEDVFAKNRAIGKKVVPLKEYFEQTAKDFKEKEAVKKEETARKKREYAKLTPCQRKMNTLQRSLDGYIGTCDRNLSNEALIEMADKARSAPVKKTRTRKPNPRARSSRAKSRTSRSARGSQ